MYKEKLKMIIIAFLIITMVVLISSCLYVKKDTLISRLTGKKNILQVQENATSIEDISKWDLEKVNIVYDTNNVAVPVPKGYVASEVKGEHTVNTGFVIYEGEEPVTGIEGEEVGVYSVDPNSAWVASCTRNQYVWVPVADSSRIYSRSASTGRASSKLWDFTSEGRKNYNEYEPAVLAEKDNEKLFAEYDIQGMTKADLLQELQKEFEATIESIEKYGGFYIGRYETGNIGSGSVSSHDTPKQPVVQRMNTNIDRSTWYDAYNNMKNIQINENVKSNIIWGNLWDETLQWIIESGGKTQEEVAIDSSTWGNYNEVEFEYISKNGTTATKKSTNTGIIPTGSSERNKANNIYDLAGNVLEFTLEPLR